MPGKSAPLGVPATLCTIIVLLAVGQACSNESSENGRSESIVFACFTYADTTQYETPIWARSIRQFGGELSDAPIWLFVPNRAEDLAAEVRAELISLGVVLHSFEIEDEALGFPLAAKVYGAAAAEALASGRHALLAWLDRDNIVVQEPSELAIGPGKVLGYRSVHHRNIGSYYDEPLDGFWRLIYDRLQVDEAALLPMTTIVDTLPIRPYINAGHLVVRPERGLLQSWLENFETLYRDSPFDEFYRTDIRYAIFVHQAILTGTILRTVDPEERVELSDAYNYPLHLTHEIPERRRAARLNDLVTPRYDFIGNFRELRGLIEIEEPLASWIDEQFGLESPVN